MLYWVVMGLHLFACFALICTVLFLQSGRGAGLMVFGGGDSLINSPTGSSFIKKTTAVLAGTFAVTSLFLTLLGTRSTMSSVTSKIPDAPASRPAAPAPAPAPAPTK